MFVRNYFNDFDDWGDFGSTFFNGQRVHIRRRNGRGNQQQRGEVNNRVIFGIPPILIPIILIILFNCLTLFSGYFEKSPVYSLNKNNNYYIYKTTKDLKFN